MWLSANSASNLRFFVTYSDDGLNWHAPIGLTTDTSIGNVQMTGSPDLTGANGNPSLFVQAMSPNVLNQSPRYNSIFRSTDGGDTWTRINQNGPFPNPGVGTCTSPDSFAVIYPHYWRDIGWGEVGA